MLACVHLKNLFFCTYHFLILRKSLIISNWWHYRLIHGKIDICASFWYQDNIFIGEDGGNFRNILNKGCAEEEDKEVIYNVCKIEFILESS